MPRTGGPPNDETPVELTAEQLQQLRRVRGERLFQLCRGRIIEHYPSLWPGEILGLAIGDQWIRNVMARLAQQRAAAQRVHVANADLVAATGLRLPS